MTLTGTLMDALIKKWMVARRKPDLPTLMDILVVDTQHKGANIAEEKMPRLSSPAAVGVLASVQQLTHDLLGDERQRYQQTLAPSYDVSAERAATRMHQQNFLMALTGFGLAIAGGVTPLFYLPSIACTLYAARRFLREGYRSVVQKHCIDHYAAASLTILVALASGSVAAMAFGVIFTSVNRYLVAKTENRSKQQIADLFGGQVRTVWRLVGDVEIETPIEQIQAGDVIVVQAGQIVPVDGEIITGMATIDQHRLTGEAQPAEKAVGDSVLASTLLLAGRICVQVRKAGEMTVAAQITHLLSQTSDFKLALKSRTERWVDSLALPVLGASALALPLAGVSGAAAVLWYYPGSRMILFGPLSMLSYLQVAAQKGILVKDGRALEVLSEVDTVVFDKTGTLTLKQPTVNRIITCSGLVEHEILCCAAAAESKQSHPIAYAILQAATQQNLELPVLEDAHYTIGYGLKTQVKGRTVRVGSLRFMQIEEIPVPAGILAQQAESHAQGHSLVWVALDQEMVGAIELVSIVRPEVKAIMEMLVQRGIEPIILSGDSEIPTHHLAAELGIHRYFAEVLPEDKAKVVAQLQAEGHKVCFVGDGINDSIALKTADVAISLSDATTIATDMAQIVFMDDSLRRFPTLFQLSDEFANNMHINLLASIVPGVVGIAGTLLFGWGMTFCVIFTQISTPVGIYNALKPLLDERRSQKDSLGNSPI